MNFKDVREINIMNNLSLSLIHYAVPHVTNNFK